MPLSFFMQVQNDQRSFSNLSKAFKVTKISAKRVVKSKIRQYLNERQMYNYEIKNADFLFIQNDNLRHV